MRRMKRWVAIVTALAALCVMMGAVGCSSGENEAQPTASAGEVADRLKNGITFVDQMSEVDLTVALTQYSIDEQDVAQGKVYMSTGATAEEIAVLDATSDEAAQRIYEALQKRVERQREDFEDYVPAELQKLEDPVLEKNGVQVVLCISDDNEAAQALLQG
ncbi:MAG TPA: DUF4358 domain-containing protein [Candidatus Gallacutalibacter stercoravium]|nr:DUF4358 domain-containing protein [Candidatus Gallacutalibacter stercoravium]